MEKWLAVSRSTYWLLYYLLGDGKTAQPKKKRKPRQRQQSIASKCSDHVKRTRIVIGEIRNWKWNGMSHQPTRSKQAKEFFSFLFDRQSLFLVGIRVFSTTAVSNGHQCPSRQCESVYRLYSCGGLVVGGRAGILSEIPTQQFSQTTLLRSFPSLFFWRRQSELCWLFLSHALRPSLFLFFAADSCIIRFTITLFGIVNWPLSHTLARETKRKERWYYITTTKQSNSNIHKNYLLLQSVVTNTTTPLSTNCYCRKSLSQPSRVV